MQNTEKLAPLDRHAIDGDASTQSLRHVLIKRGIPRRLGLSDQAALGAMPIHEDGDFQFWAGFPGGIERGENLAAGVVVLQVQRHDQDASSGAADQRQQGFPKHSRASQCFNVDGGHGDAGQRLERWQVARAFAPALPDAGKARRSGRARTKCIHGTALYRLSPRSFCLFLAGEWLR